ncbi:MAG: hypothetical protein WB810_15320 [Candidatus Cybelea sp.]
MGILRLGGFTAGVFAAAALVTGCGRAQPPLVMSGVSYQAARQSDAGLLYGTTSLGGYNGSPCNACGTVYAIFGGSSSCSGHCG